VRREFSSLLVYVGVEEGYVRRTAHMDQRQFRKYLETCRRLGFDRWGQVKPPDDQAFFQQASSDDRLAYELDLSRSVYRLSD
jgi:hypothetical protein